MLKAVVRWLNDAKKNLWLMVVLPLWQKILIRGECTVQTINSKHQSFSFFRHRRDVEDKCWWCDLVPVFQDSLFFFWQTCSRWCWLLSCFWLCVVHNKFTQWVTAVSRRKRMKMMMLLLFFPWCFNSLLPLCFDVVYFFFWLPRERRADIITIQKMLIN